MQSDPIKSFGLLVLLVGCIACGSKSENEGEPDAGTMADARTDALVEDATSDTAPPTFTGLVSVTAAGETTVNLSWSVASDLVTPSDLIVYRVYASTSSGGQTFTTPVATVTGVVATTVTNLAAGTQYYFVVRAVDGAGNADANVVERGVMTLDLTPPAFSGVTSASPAGAGSIALTWSAATDAVTAANAITYRIYVAGSSGAQNFTSPTMTTTAGATGATLTGLGSAYAAYVVVRAVDGSGNEDTNTAEASTTTLDTAPPSFAGVATATAGAQSATLGWTAATDDSSSAAQIVYLVYQATSAGGQNFSAPSYVTAAGATSFVINGLAPNTTYYFVVRARDVAGNIDAGTTERSTTTPVTDITPPSFAGVATAAAATPSSVTLTWSAATDNATPQSQIVYLIYKATTSGGQSFVTPALTTTAGATTATITGLAVATTHYFVVRAKDVSGNVDTNVIERSAATPAATVSFATDVQAIFTGNCATSMCHAGSTPAGGLDLSAGNARTSLVNVPSGDCPTIMRVQPYAATTSYLMWKIQGSGPCFSGSQMPKGSPPLSAADQAKIATWINEGALNN